ncbi:hypothetical protein D1AOALGA4SA_4675 [Olavius algarvensis Delta 1 endosymbiont]|nr:hypothetical protein D1AOALGA4SA_4675 [Olavius algarvensis Delta 1 endosymbiont]
MDGIMKKNRKKHQKSAILRIPRDSGRQFRAKPSTHSD